MISPKVPRAIGIYSTQKFDEKKLTDESWLIYERVYHVRPINFDKEET